MTIPPHSLPSHAGCYSNCAPFCGISLLFIFASVILSLTRFSHRLPNGRFLPAPRRADAATLARICLQNFLPPAWEESDGQCMSRVSQGAERGGRAMNV